MRYQQLTFTGPSDAIKNKIYPSFGVSSDFCVFNSPEFTMSGASKIDCSSDALHSITTASTISLSFIFTGNTDSFLSNNATFGYKIHQYSDLANIFTNPPLVTSDDLPYSGFSGTSAFTNVINTSDLNIDGEYLVKGYYKFDHCTEFFNNLGLIVTTEVNNGLEYGLYNNNLDYYFAVVRYADVPVLLSNGSNIPPANQLYQQVNLPFTA